jgi:hypothetical protein
MSEFMSEETVAADDEVETPSEPESSVDDASPATDADDWED